MIKLKAWKIGKWQNLISNQSNTEGWNREKNDHIKKIKRIRVKIEIKKEEEGI